MLAGAIKSLPAREENGNLYQYLLPQEKSETLEAACVTLAPGRRTQEASHPDEEELYLFIEGAAKLHVGGDETRVSSGDFAYIPRHAVHFIVNDGDKPFRYVYMANFPDRPGRTPK
ncbi:MAG TPA: cupin domain-containing protein [Planctomycetes bacterium]|nr:cupin domain-containing protein [Planctomycetota bacterium]